MPSHTYEFTLQDLLRLLASTLLPVGLFALAMHLGAAARLLPEPRPALDTDRTVLLHQAEMSRRKHEADLVLIGDSSCLMDVSARQLTRALTGRKALNLGTLSYLDLEAFGRILGRYLETNPNRVRAVVLLMHPQALRLGRETNNVYRQCLAHFYRGEDHPGPASPQLLRALGVEIFRGRLLSRALPRPLSGAFGEYYGFTHDLWNYLSAHDGSALDPHRFDPAAVRGTPELRLAKSLEEASHDFRAIVPPGVKLIVGITPMPRSFATPDAPARCREMLLDWQEWLHADAALVEMPAVWPDTLFASTTHLNERGVRRYTEELGRALEASLK